MDTPDIRVRLATADDAPGILDVCSAALGWTDPEFDRALFSWKHFSNAFGPSIILVAEGDDGLLAVRPFMRWAFASRSGTIHAARAVDTATRPEAQGRGLFRTLTEAGLSELESRHFGFVFNTPNDQSRPGYLKMGWREAGKVSFGFGLRSPLRIANVLRSRTAATKPSIETSSLGVDVTEGLRTADLSVLEPDAGRMLRTAHPHVLRTAHPHVLRTAHTYESLLWRFAAGPVTYRWLPTGDGQGCIVRLRQRGASRELVVAQCLAHPASSSAWTAIRQAMRQTNADYCLTPAGLGSARTITRLGPSLALRDVTQPVASDRFDWTPGDIELF